MNRYRSIIARTLKAVALFMALYHLYVAFAGPPNALILRSIHVGFALVLTFLIYDYRGKKTDTPSWLDLLIVLAGFAAGAYPVIFADYFFERYYMVDPLNLGDWVFGSIMIVLVFEASRRVLGWALPLTAFVFLGYAIFFTNVTISELIDQLYLTTEGIFGIPVGVSATYMVLFIIFGAFVERAGIGKLFMDFALSITGHSAGGPAKVACITSGMFGSVSGSSVANVMTTGTFTIPLMKKIGYRPAFAGAVEAVASTGGQIMPPIMGAAAFVMAEFLGVSYLSVIGFAILPALLYYVALFSAVHFEARKLGMVGLPRDQLPRIGAVLKEQGHLFIPMAVIIMVLFMGYSPPYAAMCGIVSVVPTALLRKTSRGLISVRMIVDGLIEGAINTLPIALACACAGIVVGSLNITGLGLTFTQVVVALSQNSLVPALILTMIAGVILGMGMPTTPAYIIQVALLVPALVKLGVAAEAAHLFVFYYACLSTITPPVAMAVYAANGISKAGLWESGVAAVKLGATGYIVPFMFVFGPSLMLIGPWYRVSLAMVTASVGAICLASALQGHLLRISKWWERVLLGSAALMLIVPGWRTDGVGFGLLVIVLFLQFAKSETRPVEIVATPK